MKNFLFIFSFLSILGCQDDIQSNNPVLQGLRHGDYIWRSSTNIVTLQTTGILNISGSDGYGTMVITLPSINEGVYELGQGKPATITYQEINTIYSTQNNGNDFPVYLGDGQVTIDFVNVQNKTIQGSFYFNSYDSSGTSYMNFSEGIFFNLSYIDD